MQPHPSGRQDNDARSDIEPNLAAGALTTQCHLNRGPYVIIHSEGRDAVRRRLHLHGLIAAACAVALIGQLVPCAIAQERSDAQAAPRQTQTEEELAERALDRTLVSTGAVLLPPG